MAQHRLAQPVDLALVVAMKLLEISSVLEDAVQIFLQKYTQTRINNT
jgi:hypothetical protein